MRKLLDCPRKNEKGQALILVMVLMLLSALIIGPLLQYMSTGIYAGKVFEKKADELYAADAGIEDALWQIRNDKVDDLFQSYSPAYDIYDYFTDNWTYALSEQINGKDVNITIENVWIPKDINAPDKTTARNIIQSAKLVVTGTVSDPINRQYRIKITYYPGAGEDLRVQKVGIWLPPGFDYVTGSCNLGTNPAEEYYSPNPAITIHAGGKAVVWSFTLVSFEDFPGVNPGDFPMESNITFNFTSNQPNRSLEALPWITTSGVLDIPYSWDADIKIFRITSVAGGTTVEGYAIKSQLRQMSAAVSGDYYATGNTLMRNAYFDSYYIRDTWVHTDVSIPVNSSSNNVPQESSQGAGDGIPPDANVAAAYLYWTSWFDASTSIFSDSCGNFNNWTRNDTGGSQTRVPTADGDIRGTWNTSPCWDDIDETSYDDVDYMTGTTTVTGSAYMLFNFSPFSLPAGAVITDLTIYYRAREVSNGFSNILPCIMVNGNRYNGTGVDPNNSFTTRSHSYTTNPNTRLAWTPEDLNGTGPNPLQQFGVYSSDLDPDVQVSMVYAQVNYESSSCWSISGGQFRGRGASSATTAQRTLTLTNSLDLSSYASGTVGVSWEQDENGYLESSDYLYFAFSNDGGSSWSANIPAFNDDNPDSPFSYTIPDTYLNNNFKMRFYFTFNDQDEFVYIDNIEFTVMEADTTVYFKIDGQLVYFDGSNNPQVDLTGTQQITADMSKVIQSTSGYSYACVKNVTDLVLSFAEDDDGEYGNDGDESDDTYYPGIATYTVGGVNGTLGDDNPSHTQLSHAGWSLVVIYSSPATLGHQLYLYGLYPYGRFTHAFDYTNVDFDADGNPGGTISGFIVPERIWDDDLGAWEVNAAKISVFVGEGDDFINGDYLAFNGTKLWDGTVSGSLNDVWNGLSTIFSADGVDVDTFYVTWASGLLDAGDTSAQIDLYTDQDNWNLVFIIISFRSETTTGGTVTYLILQ
jgi:hypothetical protein